MEGLAYFDHLANQYFKGNLSREEQDKLSSLLETDIRYRERYKKLSREFARNQVPYFERIKDKNWRELSSRLKSISDEAPLTTFRPVKSYSWKNTLRIAACFLGLLGTLSLFLTTKTHFDQNVAPLFCRIEVPNGGQSRIVLPDGSHVFLNAGSSLVYDSDLGIGKTRRVQLSGEAYFEIEKDSLRPFIVNTEEVHIKVLGTKFNVRSYPDSPEITVSLNQGRVNVYTENEYDDNIILEKNESAVFDKTTNQMTKCTQSAEMLSQWTSGKMCFVNSSLPEILKEIERRYDVNIEIKSSRMHLENFTGTISTRYTIDEILDYINVEQKYTWTRDKNKITFSDN